MTRTTKVIYPQLSFIFTSQGFVCDVIRDEDGRPLLAEESRSWYADFEMDRIRALYNLGFISRKPWFSPSMAFLHRVSEFFINHTIQQPDIELLRENALPHLDESDRAALLLTVPFVTGSEYITAAWIDEICSQLTDIYRAELTDWEGNVESYVAERTQNLRVPERIFFHLVENRLGAGQGFPFAFVATYATEIDGAIRHFPLRNALEQYKDDTT